MNEIVSFFHNNLGFTIGCCWVIAAACGSLRAPTEQSSQAYVTLFAVSNLIAANIGRILPPKVEDSPNFQAAVQKAVDAQKSGTKIS